MGKKKKLSLPFDRLGGVIMLHRPMLESDAYLRLTAQAKCLLVLMQIHWRNEKPVAYSVAEAMKKIPCAKLTARNAFDELQQRGFIVMIDESLFCSRLQSKSRTWRLTWLPYDFKPPTHNWKNTMTGSNPAPEKNLQGQICTS